MIELISREQKSQYDLFSSFVEKNIQPFAGQWEKNEEIPSCVIEKCIAEGYLGCTIPEKYCGNGWDSLTYGLFTESIAKASTSFSGLFNVHTMLMQTLLKWGTDNQKDKWLPSMCRGELLGAFALTEPDAGSDIKGIQTKILSNNNTYVINGKKRWITFGGLADIFLVFGKLEENKKEIAVIVEKESKGLRVIPITNMLGFRAGNLAVLEFNNCIIPKENLVAKPGFAFSHIAPYALEYGRISVAYAAIGILKGCLDYCCRHVLKRKSFGSRLIEQSTIKEMITKMGVDYEAASHLCINATKAKDLHDPNSSEKVMLAKYFTTRAANYHTNNAVQILGAIGCSENHPVCRYYRDCKVMEIIEGSNQIHEMILGNSFVRKYRNSGYKTTET